MRLATGNDLVLGNLANGGGPLALSRTQRDKHLYVCGSTGTGKSKFLENLIRQDIRGWQKSKCGLLLLDPHGSLYDSILGWLASRAIDRPVIPIDLRQDDWVVGYNVLRNRPGSDPSVVVDNFVQAMAYVWGQSDTQQTPLFARWASNILSALYEKELTLVEAEHLINHQAKRVRYQLTSNLSNRLAARDWAYAATLSPKDFEDQISSTVNRLRPFLTTKLIRQMFGQSGQSLDLGRALEEGSIILVNLAIEKGRVTDNDSSLFATLLLADLWAAARERGKRSDGRSQKPFYVYCDEFQNFITPTIAKNLDQARGFGLHLTLAHQFPNQLLHAGAHGKQVYDSVMVNARSKVVFSIETEENLRPLAQALFMGVMNPDIVKHQLHSTKVMAYVEEYRAAYSRSVSSGSGKARSRGSATGAGFSGTDLYTGEGRLLPSIHLNDLTSISRSASVFDSDSMSESDSISEAVNESETLIPMLIPKMGQELSSVQFRSLEEQLFRAMAVLFDQGQRQCVTRLAGERVPVSLHTPTVLPVRFNAERIATYRKRQLEKCPFALKGTDAENKIVERERTLIAGQAIDSREPVSSRRRIR